MATIRHMAAWLFVVALCSAASDRATAAILLPDLASVIDDDATVVSSAVPIVPEDDAPLPDPVATTNPAPAIPTTGMSGPATGGGSAGPALLNDAILVVGDAPIERLRPESPPGWGLFQWGGIFRPPRSAA